MGQKTIWMRYLIIGTSILLVSFFVFSCGNTEVEYRLDADFIYKNETNYKIQYYELLNNDKFLLFEIAPNSEKIIESRGDGGNKNQEIDNCCQGILEGYQGRNTTILIVFDEVKCITYQNGEGPTTGNLSSYTSRTISQRYYEFTYTFTEEQYNQAGDCN